MLSRRSYCLTFVGIQCCLSLGTIFHVVPKDVAVALAVLVVVAGMFAARRPPAGRARPPGNVPR